MAIGIASVVGTLAACRASPQSAAPASPNSAAPGSGAAVAPTLVIKSLDAYGTTRIDVAWAKAQFGDAMQRMVATHDEAESRRVRTEITDAIRARYPDLDGPTTTDRNKAAAIVDGLVRRPDSSNLRHEVIARAGPTLLKLLALGQPNNHDFAYQILKQVSGQDFGEHDVDRWRAWLLQQH